MRLRQLVGLKWRDLDFDAMAITLRAETSKTRREWSVPIADSLLPQLLDLRRRTTWLLGENIADRQVFCLPIFSHCPGKFKLEEMHGERVIRFFNKLTRSMGEGAVRITAHKLRHTTATQLLRGHNARLKVVQELLGHTSINTTMGYVHPDLDDMRAAVETL